MIRSLVRGGDTWAFVMAEPDVAVLVVGERIEDCNPNACRLLGRTREQLVGTDLPAIATADAGEGGGAADVAHERLAAARLGRPQHGTWRIRRGDGTELEAVVHVEAVEIDTSPRLLVRLGSLPHLEHGEDSLRRAAAAVSTPDGDGVFRELVLQLAVQLDVEVAFIALPLEADPCRMRMLAFYVDGRMIEDVEYPLAGTPCETVIGQQYRLYASGLQELFPGDADFRNLGLQSYAGHPLSDSRGGPLGLIAVVSRRPFARPSQIESMLKIFAARAVTEIERRRSDQALRTAEASYRAIFEAAEDAIFVHDWESGAIVDANPKACEVCARSQEELRRIPLDELGAGTPPWTGADALRWIGQAKRDGSAQFEWLRRNPDGSLHWDEVRLKVASLGGRPHVLAFTREITGRKHAEAALRASEQRYRLLFEMESDAIVLVDIASLRILDANRAACDLYGYSREELLALRATDLSVEPDRTAASIRAQEGVARIPLRHHRRRDGAIFPVEIANNTFDLGGRPAIIAAIRDVTERRRAEEERAQLEAQLRQAQKMEAIGQLTGGIAHDFNNILTGIMGYVALASDRPAAQSDARLVHFLDQAQAAVRRARDLIQQMLTFSRGQRGEPRPIALGALVDDTVRLLRSTLPSSIEIETDLGCDLPAALLDPVHVEQVLLNLCINARDAMNGSGRIGVSLRLVDGADEVCASCRQRVRGSAIELAVADDGPGIAAQVMDRMFEPFFSTKGVGQGSGMGLASVHGIVHEHGGHVIVDSVEGAGAVFRVRFPPLDRATRAQIVEGRESTAVAGGRPPLRGRVLVVDDEAMVGDMLGEMLGGWGLEVTVERSAVAAERWYCEAPGRVDLVLTDQTMPRVTGLELAQRLTLLRPELPVILCTGYGAGITDEQAARSGLCALLVKPVEPDVLYDVLRTHLPHVAQ